MNNNDIPNHELVFRIEKMENDIKNINKEVDKINLEMVTMVQDIKKIPDTVNLSINSSIEAQFEKIDEKVGERILVEFDRKELEERRKREIGLNDLKTHTKKQFISYFVTALLTAIGGIFIFSLTQQNENKQEIINDYYNEISELKQELNQIKQVQP